MIKLTGLWANESKNGEKYMAGTIGGAKVLIMRNKFKGEGSREPDYNLYVVEKERKKEGGPDQGQRGPYGAGDDMPF